MKRILGLLFTFSAFPAYALDSQIVYNTYGIAGFEVRIFDKEDRLPDDPEGILNSTWNLDALQKREIHAAMGNWAEIIKAHPGYLPAIVNVTTFDAPDNAIGISEFAYSAAFSPTKLQAVLEGKNPGPLVLGAHAQFILGKFPYGTVPYVPSQLPRSGGIDLAAVAFHELAHGLGIQSAIGNRYGVATPYFFGRIGSWAEHLRDDNGNPGNPGQAVLCSKCSNPYDPNAFDVRNDRGYFTGNQVNEVLADEMPGIPVKTLYKDGRLDNNYMSHSELKNSLMSHQDYRNYTTFMEAELAAMQDMGYTIDRRNFYGYSIYGDGKTLVNDNGFFQRNAEGTTYIPGQYNIAMLGLGLHVYGSRNMVVQRADLLTRGGGGAGVRVDGEGNSFTVLPDTRIHADGLNGRGVMFTYGKDHDFIQRGNTQALGEGGIAASFDFGNNIVGNDVDYRGSYIHTLEGQPAEILDELNGALVDQVDISGRLAGSHAAIYISSNALVNRINILRGAQLEGEIISLYDEKDANGNKRLTKLSFGLLADENGVAIGGPDPRFNFVYNNDIQGITNLALVISGGWTTLNGSHQLYGANVEQAATLAGDSSYKLHEAGGGFANNGTVAPGNSTGSIGRIDIMGDYVQGSTGQLLIGVDSKGVSGILTVSGNAALDGRLGLTPVRGWYAHGWKTGNIRPLQAGSISGAFSTVAGELASPTLTVLATREGDDSYELTVARKADAYNQYGSDGNTRAVGWALDKIVAQARPDIQPLYSALDFSAADGGTVARALSPLSPAGYSAMIAGSLNREQQISEIVTTGIPTATDLQKGNDGWRAFAMPFGSGSNQKRENGISAYDGSSYGLVFGVERGRTGYPDLVVGLHAAFTNQSVNVKAPNAGDGEINAFGLGLHARYAEDPLAGVWLFGQARLGIEDASMTRRLHFNDYSGRGEANWTGWIATVAAGGGYRFALSDTASVGPVVSLNFMRLTRPDLTEQGNAGRLSLGSADFNALRSSLGITGTFTVPLPLGSAVKATAQLSWDHALLNGELLQDASFAGYPDAVFETRNRIGQRDAFKVQAGLNYDISTRTTLGASLGGTLSRSGHDFSGRISAILRF
ncbi:autotransporter domain-containing protein [Phyllobacterium salinisoli]|uniref:Autotransporter domain-containing protein n=1 Tax=Phyllobacterium salinisoli TaxID=1899321 RepID=A0A368JYJ2_9HYPH|nr:autotransporter outer membrane beta-barrel domain-containing protein [Phyllobacterium salinisoli]RCS22031.1 autotransporter domain-containing protein [Phyllobacterium salinisoli]